MGLTRVDWTSLSPLFRYGNRKSRAATNPKAMYTREAGGWPSMIGDNEVFDLMMAIDEFYPCVMYYKLDVSLLA